MHEFPLKLFLFGFVASIMNKTAAMLWKANYVSITISSIKLAISETIYINISTPAASRFNQFYSGDYKF